MLWFLYTCDKYKKNYWKRKKQNRLLYVTFAYIDTYFQFDDQNNETRVEDFSIIRSRVSNDNTIKYVIEEIVESTRFGIKIAFERKIDATYGILINYHLMCSMIIMVSAINFLVDPKMVTGRAGLLVTLFLVLTNFFCKAQVWQLKI